MLIQKRKKVKHSAFFSYEFDKFLKMIYNNFRISRRNGKMEKFRTIIVGAGAAGLMAALRLGEAGCKGVLLLERNDRAGRKLSSTGNGQGNITNADLSEAHYRSSDKRLVASVLHRVGKDELLRYMESLGGLFIPDESGRIYPASRQASSVTDLLRFRLAALNIPLQVGKKVTAVQKRGNIFIVYADGAEYSCRSLILACGGKAAPHFGTDGNGYTLARAFGHTITQLRASLQWKTDAAAVRGLRGTRCGCHVTLLRGGNKRIAATEGDIIFTDYGISGNAVFYLSPLMREGDTLSIDFLPEVAENKLLQILQHKAETYPAMPTEDLFRCIVNSAIGKSIIRRCGVEPTKPVRMLADKLNILVHMAKNYEVQLVGSLGFDSAQVTQGGVLATELDQNLMSRKAEGLYIVGELVDADGDCGGYNLQWAFSSGWVAAEAILQGERCE